MDYDRRRMICTGSLSLLAKGSTCKYFAVQDDRCFQLSKIFFSARGKLFLYQAHVVIEFIGSLYLFECLEERSSRTFCMRHKISPTRLL